MANNCPACDFKITARNQLCDDYRDPVKAYGCPQCGRFYLLPGAQRSWRRRWTIFSGLVLFNITLSAIFSYASVASMWPVAGGITVTMLAVIALLKMRDVKMIESGHQRDVSNE